MAEQLATPGFDDPYDESEYRFRTNGTACEWGESYHPGGYHPVHFGDLFKDQYRVIRKLGYGSFGIVWLTYDMLSSRYVALKIAIAKANKFTELDMYRRIGNTPRYESACITMLLDHFEHNGPNGTHLCLVFELMGPNIPTMLDVSQEYRGRRTWDRPRFPKSLAKRILRDVLLALQHLHSQGVVHGDLHPGNILFQIRDLNSVPNDSLKHIKKQPRALTRIDGKLDPWAPQYLVEPESLHEYVVLEKNPVVKIIDLGAAFLVDSAPLSTATPVALRAPELILGRSISYGIDIWCVGCLIFELITGKSLFSLDTLGGCDGDQFINDEHLIEITEILQPLPEDLRSKWQRESEYYGPNGVRVHLTSDDGDAELSDDLKEDAWHDTEELGKKLESGTDTDMCNIGDDFVYNEEFRDDTSSMLADLPHFDPLEKIFRRAKPADIDEREERQIVTLIRQILQPYPEQRPSAKNLLADPWFLDVSEEK